MFRVNLFKLKKNKRYNYTPRYYKGKSEGNIYDFDSKFSKYRGIFNENDFGKQWQEVRLQMRAKKNRGLSSRLVLIILVLAFLSLYILDFDFSIFFLTP